MGLTANTSWSLVRRFAAVCMRHSPALSRTGLLRGSHADCDLCTVFRSLRASRKEYSETALYVVGSRDIKVYSADLLEIVCHDGDLSRILAMCSSESVTSSLRSHSTVPQRSYLQYLLSRFYRAVRSQGMSRHSPACTACACIDPDR